jgi:hypothetical protein
MSLELTTEKGMLRYPVRPTELAAGSREGVEIDVEPLTPRRVRLRIMTAQLEGDGAWKALTLHVTSPGEARPSEMVGAFGRGEWCGAIFRAAERGPKKAEATPNGFDLHLYPPSAPPFPADEGFHVTHEIILERSRDPDGLARRVNRPLRASWPPDYVAATRAMGGAGVTGERSLDRAFETAWNEIRQLQSLPRNRGWTSWGDFYDGTHTLAYAGYLCQEYDPATAFFVHHALTGDADALDLACDMARQYADACTGLDGGSYQHRATLHALEDQIARPIAERLRERWRSNPGLPADTETILAYVQATFGEKAASFAGESQRRIAQRTADPGAKERLISEALAQELVHSERENLVTDPGVARRFRDREPSLEEYAGLLLSLPSIAFYHLPALSEIYAPFFRRYGGSWSDFPAFHFYPLASERLAHDPSHSLAEMLVWGYLWTGDPSLRGAALRVARYHVESDLVDRAVKEVTGQREGKRPCAARSVGWPLINLLALETLAERSEPELQKKITGRIDQLVATILRIEPGLYAGSIHVGIVGEALARYDERHPNERVRHYLVTLERTWASRQWDERRNGFRYLRDRDEGFSPELTGLCLYGLAYAARLSNDPLLNQRARQAAKVVADTRTGYVKSIAQNFRGSLRAAGFLENPGK